ncbi:MAG: DUF3240 family protein [Hyphomicrobium sp.]|nr:DUF3240 family protein [Hyphomicrobium sp.]
MDQPLCKLTLVCPPAGAQRLIEVMLTLDPPIAGFTTWTAEGHGFGFATASVSERVRGRVKRSVLVAVLESAELPGLLRHIEEKASLPHLTFWTEPVTNFGQMQNPSLSRARGSLLKMEG